LQKKFPAVELIARSYVNAQCQWISVALASRLLRLGRIFFSIDQHRSDMLTYIEQPDNNRGIHLQIVYKSL